MSKKKLTPAEFRAAQIAFVGAQMSNILYAIGNETGIPAHIRREAKEAQEKWDSIAPLRLNNPIVAMELNATLFPKS